MHNLTEILSGTRAVSQLSRSSDHIIDYNGGASLFKELVLYNLC